VSAPSASAAAARGASASTSGESAPETGPATPSSPLPAKAIVDRAVAAARAGHKAVLIEFGASWCVWCRHFEAFTHAPGVRDIIDRHYVLANLTVEERDEKPALENPGGAALLQQWGGASSGLPFYVFLNGDGRKIADSNVMPGGQNIGFPAVPAERDAFMGLIDRTAPSLAAADRQTILAYLNTQVH
jgi:thiol:disulfide interchange protein